MTRLHSPALVHPAPSRSPPDPRAIAEAWSEAYGAADLDALAGLYAEHAVLADEGSARRRHGIAAIRREMEQRWADYRSGGVAVGCRRRHVVSDDERAVLEWTDPLGLPFCSVFDCRGGLIVAQRDYDDSRDRERLYG